MAWASQPRTTDHQVNMMGGGTADFLFPAERWRPGSVPPQGCGMRRPTINGEQGFSPSDGRFLGSLVGAGTKVCGTIEYGPPTRCGPDVNRRLVSARVELPPEHAAILVEEICSHGYHPVAPMVRVADGPGDGSSRIVPGK